MDIHELAIIAAKQIWRLLSGSKKLEAEKENAFGKAISWIRHRLFKIRPEIEQQLDSAATSQQKEAVLNKELQQLLQQDDFKQELLSWMKSLQNEPTIKNYLNADIHEIEGDVHVGDETVGGQQTSESTADIKNVVMGTIGKMKGNLHVGDKQTGNS